MSVLLTVSSLSVLFMFVKRRIQEGQQPLAIEDTSTIESTDMSNSKSTEKLAEMNSIVETVFNSISTEKADKLLELNITWQSVTAGDTYDESVACPNLSMKFAE